MNELSLSKSVFLNELKSIKLLFNEPVKNFTYTKTGGSVDILAFPKSKDAIINLVKFCKKHEIIWTVLGNASNLIVRDGGIRGMVIMLIEMNQIYIQDNQIIADAGAKLIDTSYKALACHLTGLEFACGIPGSVGGAVYMNAGAYGGEIKDVLTSVEVLFADGSINILTNKNIQFSYRHSAIEEMGCIVLNATFSLRKGNHGTIKSKMDELTHLRESKQPLEYPSCGSVFKRPQGHFTGKLIEEAGLKGLKWGGAQISEKHAGFIVNVNDATATDYVQLIQHIQQVISDQFDVTLETEVRIIGDETQI